MSVALTRTWSPLLMFIWFRRNDEKWMRSGRPLLGITGSLVQLNSAFCLTASLKYLLRVMASQVFI